MEGSKKMMKRPIKEVYGSDASDGFNKGKAETVERYRALLRLSNEHRLSEIELLQAANKANSIASQIELLEEIIKAKGKFDFTAELEKLKEKLMEADGMLADVKVKIPDWCKLEEKWLWMKIYQMILLGLAAKPHIFRNLYTCHGNKNRLLKQQSNHPNTSKQSTIL
ncbi:hypothetical protein YC2023_052981 [Brassica napus]